MSSKKKYFDDVDILTSRPEGMDYTEYKQRMKAQNQVIKQYLKGEFIHLSKLFPSAQVLAHFGLRPDATKADIFKTAKTKGNESVGLIIKGFTYIKGDK